MKMNTTPSTTSKWTSKPVNQIRLAAIILALLFLGVGMFLGDTLGFAGRLLYIPAILFVFPNQFTGVAKKNGV